MDSVQSRKIKIRYGEKCMNIYVTNNTLKKSVLKDYFPDGGTLTYQIDGETYLLDTDAQSIYVNANVDIYDINVPKGLYNIILHHILYTILIIIVKKCYFE